MKQFVVPPSGGSALYTFGSHKIERAWKQKRQKEQNEAKYLFLYFLLFLPFLLPFVHFKSRFIGASEKALLTPVRRIAKDSA
jgi:hypothetical protein